MELIGRPDRAARDWFGTGAGRADHADEILTGAGLCPDEISDLRQREVVA